MLGWNEVKLGRLIPRDWLARWSRRLLATLLSWLGGAMVEAGKNCGGWPMKAALAPE